VSSAAVRIQAGTRLVYDGDAAQVVELLAAPSGVNVVLRVNPDHLIHVPLRELLTSDRVRVVPTEPGPASDDPWDTATVVLAELTERERLIMRERAAHVREVLTGFRSGSSFLAAPGEPRTQFDPQLPLMTRYQAKAQELGMSVRALNKWVVRFHRQGDAGLAPRSRGPSPNPTGKADLRWVDTALEVMVEHTDLSRPSETMVIRRTNARVIARYGADVVRQPSRSTAFRVLAVLERRHPTFRLSTKRNRDIADRPKEVYGKLRPTRPGEYLLMDSTRLDVFALDPVTLRWVRAELTIALDWYTRCVTGLRVTPVSTKSIDAATVLYQTFRPRPPGQNWPKEAVWPDHGIPRAVLMDVDTITGSVVGAAHPAIVPDTLVVDHGRIFVSEHLMSVCERLGISVQPARLKTARDKGPVERFFETLREDLLQVLPGYKGPDVYSRGVDPESEAFFFLDELEDIIREWVAVVYDRRPHSGLSDPHLHAMKMSPAMMFEHGVARAGYIEASRDPDLAYEFLKTVWRTIQHYGVEIGGRRYNGSVLDRYRNTSSAYGGKAKGRWPFQVDTDDVTRIYFRDPDTRRYHALVWEHAPSLMMPFSEDALAFARELAAAKYTYPDDTVAVADLFERWKLGLGATAKERRIALRMSRDQAVLLKDLPGLQEPEVAQLPSVARVMAAAGADEVKSEGSDSEEQALETGDDDSGEPEDFYADALEDVWPGQP
jgi:transposase InsO family protein